MKDVVNRLVRLKTMIVKKISKFMEKYSLFTPFLGSVFIIGTYLNLFKAPNNNKILTKMNFINNTNPYEVEKILLISPSIIKL